MYTSKSEEELGLDGFPSSGVEFLGVLEDFGVKMVVGRTSSKNKISILKVSSFFFGFVT